MRSPSLLIFGVLLVTTILALEEPVNKKKVIQCDKVLLDAGLSENFGDNVGHAIHSLHLRALKKFKPDVTENNHVPTINLDLSSPIPILPYAPDRTTPNFEHYHTEGSAIIDEILSHMNEDYLSKNYSPLEQLVHGFHMEELWAIALKEYRKFEANPPSQEVCSCAVDIENNGILTKLRQMALYMREPNIMYGDTVEGLKRKPGKEVLQWASNDDAELAAKGYNPNLLLKGSDSLPTLEDTDSWDYYRSTGFHQHNETDAALYLYCILKEDANAYEQPTGVQDDGQQQPLKYSGWPSGHVQPLKYSGWPSGHVAPLKYSGWPSGHVQPLKYSGWPSGHVQPLKYSGWPSGHVAPLKYSGWPSGHVQPLKYSGWPSGHVAPLKYSGWPSGHVAPLKYSGWPSGHVKPLKYSGWPSGHVKPLDPSVAQIRVNHVKPLKYSGWPSGHVKPLGAKAHEQHH